MDILERLRRAHQYSGVQCADCLAGAAEIERLRAALNEIRGCPDWYAATKIACSALFPADEQDVVRAGIDNRTDYPCTVKQPDGTVVVINPGEKKFADVPAIPVTGAVEQSAPMTDNQPLVDAIRLQRMYAAENKRLRAALEDVVDTLEAMDLHVDNPLYERTRAALEQSVPTKLSGRWVSSKEYHHDPACAITMGGECNCDPGEQAVPKPNTGRYMTREEIAADKTRIGAEQGVLLDPPMSVLALVKDMAGCELCWDADEEVLRRVLRKCAEAAGIVVEQSVPKRTYGALPSEGSILEQSVDYEKLRKEVQGR